MAKKLREHDRMIDIIMGDKSLLACSLYLKESELMIHGKEHPIRPWLKDRVDLVFQDGYLSAYKGNPNATRYVVELKSKKANHEVVGQLKKAIDGYNELLNIKQFCRVIGVAIAKEITPSGLKLLM